jgi:hypothetical protein
VGIPRPPTYAHAAARTAIALIVQGARASEDDPSNFEAIERSASEALLDVFTRFLRSLGTATRAASEHAGRSESNLADLFASLGNVNADAVNLRPRELLAFLEEAPEVAFPVNLSTSLPVPRESPAAPAVGSSSDPRPAHVPDFLPPLPEKHTYARTATHNSRTADGPAAKKRRSKHRRQAQESLLALAEASGGDAEGASAGPPPPPLPALPGEDAQPMSQEAARETGAEERATSGAARRDEGVAALARMPDVLVPGLPAVMQSSARLESSGIVAPSVQTAAAAGGGASEAEAVAAAAAAAPARQAAILGLKHTHGLDGLDDGRGGGGGGD